MDVVKIIERNNFFEKFNEQGLTFDSWLDSIEKENNKELIQQHFSQSTYLKNTIQSKLAETQYKINIMAIIAEWCGDCRMNIPIIAHIADSSPKIELKLLIKEQNMELVKTTNGGEKIPQVLFYGEDGHHITTWVERPTIAYKRLTELYQQVGFEDASKISKGWRKIFKECQNEFYQAVANEIISIIDRINGIQGTSRRINTTR
ncbi:MAG: thioredoxin family protein [Candidatus Hodarchaeales archaeon]|jgi:hypothetical protein